MNNTDPVVPETAPLSPEQKATLNSLIQGLQADQLLWIEGFISGLRAGSGASAPTEATTTAPELTVLYGTESGNSESLADQIAKAAKAKGFKAKAVNMADTKVAKLKGIENLLVIVSTWGEGDPPETATEFYEEFMSDKAPKLEKTRFSVLGLGDTSYEDFCKMGKDFDARLEALGAKRISDRVDCDVDYDDDFEAWKKSVLAVLEKEAAPTANASTGATAAAATTAVKYSRKNPYPSELLERVMLNGEGSAKETIHLEFNLEGSGLTYEAGDALAVIPHNADEVVNEIIATNKLDANAPVLIKEQEYTLRDALTSQLDVTAISLPVLKRWNEIAKDAKLEKMLLPENKSELQDYLYGREIIDVLHDFPAKEVTADALVGIMRKLPPRLYSIASSPKAHPGEVHLTVGVVRYDAHGRKRKGVCSTYLADRIVEGGKADVFVTPNKHFKIPANNDAPMIMVGPGTGIAPFRAFVEERKEIGAKGKNWLFFGDQHYLTDFLYQTEWQDYLADGILTKLDVAFSRDQKDKVYVQDRMRENSKELYQWLEQGASFYVCGDASRMATDVDVALHDIVEKEGGLSKDDAAAYVKKLKDDKRYLRDVY